MWGAAVPRGCRGCCKESLVDTPLKGLGDDSEGPERGDTQTALLAGSPRGTPQGHRRSRRRCVWRRTGHLQNRGRIGAPGDAEGTGCLRGQREVEEVWPHPLAYWQRQLHLSGGQCHGGTKTIPQGRSPRSHGRSWRGGSKEGFWTQAQGGSPGGLGEGWSFLSGGALRHAQRWSQLPD